MKGNIVFWSAILLLGAGCGGSQEPAHTPDDVDEPKTEQPKAEAPKTDEGGDEAKKEDGDEPKGDEGKAPAKEPEFKDDMSVDEAINAVPQGTPRVNVDQETLGKPLMEEGLYKPCKLSPAQHFKVKVAIWEGKAVGVDVIPTPKNDKVVSCVKTQIKGITWKDKVKSLNTVEYQF